MRDYPISAVPGPTAPSSYALHGVSDGSVVVPIGVDAHLDGVGGGVPWPLAVPCVPALGFGRERYHRLGVIDLLVPGRLTHVDRALEVGVSRGIGPRVGVGRFVHRAVVVRVDTVEDAGSASDELFSN